MFQSQKCPAAPAPPDAAPLPAGFFRAAARTLTSHRLGDLLVDGGLITRQQLRHALREQGQTKEQIGRILLRQGALSAVQLYRKLAEQWCLRASAAGIAVLVQAMPLTARAEDSAAPATLSAQFRMASATAAVPHFPRAERSYPQLLGAAAVRSDDISAFKKWTGMLARFQEQLDAPAARAPRVRMWQAEIDRLRGRPQREQVEAIDKYFNNNVAYIEDIDNYGKTDYWATPIEFLSRGGDCEDYAIAKYASLIALGFAPDQLRISIVQDTVKDIPHAILLVYSDDGDFVLDNQEKKTRPINAVTRYQPIFSINGASWWLHRA